MAFDAVVFDFHGTLARPAEGTSGYRTVLTRLGFGVSEVDIEAWVESFDGAEHSAHSTDERSYGAWSRGRLAHLAELAQVPSGPQRDAVVEELDRWGRGSVMAYVEAYDVLKALKVGGLRLAICSNWGWHLDPYIEQAGLHELVDIALTSARVGARKPHPKIYAATLNALRLRADRVLFVGDNVRADVHGPLDAGFGAAVHVWRSDRADHRDPGVLMNARAYRVSDLTGVLDVVWSHA
jgi:putative hydrolase of the HAD superfamily